MAARASPPPPRACQTDCLRHLLVLASLGAPSGQGGLLITNSFSSKLRHFIRKVSLGWGLSK